MNFSFGSPSTTVGNTLGTTTPSTGFAFGSGDTKPLFGGAGAGQGENKPAFSFTSTTTSAPAFGGFSFGSKTTTATPSMFGTPPTTTTSAFGASKPLSFGGMQSPPNQTVGSPGFGQPAGQSPAQNLTFGAPPSTQPPAFGTPPTQALAAAAPAPAPGGALFGQAGGAGGPNSGFAFSTPATGFSAATNQITAPSQTSQPTFGLKPAPPTTAAPAFGQTSAFGKPAAGFSFGQTAATTATAAPTFGSPGSTFGQTQGQQTATAQPALSFGASSVPSLTPASTGGISSTASTLGSGATLGTSGTLGSTGALGTSGTMGASGTLGNTGTLGSSGGLGTTGTPGLTGTLGGFNFGATTAATSQPTGLNFGNTSFGNTQQSPAAPQSQAPKLSFGTPAAPPALAASTAQPTATLGAVSTAAQPTAVSFGATTQASGIKFGTPPSTAATSAPTGLTFGTGVPSSAAATSAPVSLSLAPPASAAPLTLATSAPGPAPAPAPAGLTFPAATSAPASTAATTSASAGISLLGKSTAATTLPSLAPATTTPATGPPQPISSVTFAQLEENINKWTIELEEQEKTFINQATQINAWDRLLIANGEKIVELNDAVETVKNEQQTLEHELDFVLGQQRELEELLTPLEGAVQPNDNPRDPQRAHMYSLAENLDTQLRQMSEDLKEVIEHLNETNRSQDSNDPIVQIGRILNAHMSSMQWIDNSIAQISTKLDQLKATHDTLRRDNERSFQLTYN